MKVIKIKRIIINICFCRMGAKNLKKNIMIYKPFKIIQKRVFLRKNNKDDSIKNIVKKYNKNILPNTYTKNINYNVYIYYKKYLLKIENDNTLIDLFNYFNINKIKIYVFKVLGGASIHNSGYRFTVHSDENIHKNQPHVHVYKNDNGTRYSLETFERFKNDKICKEIKKDEKKIIIPFIKKNKNLLMEFWNNSINGYTPPTINEENKQFYDES